MIDWILNLLGAEKCPKRDVHNRSSGTSYCVRPEHHFGKCKAYNGKTIKTRQEVDMEYFIIGILVGFFIGLAVFGIAQWAYNRLQVQSHNNDITVEQITEWVKDKVEEWGNFPIEEDDDSDLAEMDNSVPLVAREKKKNPPPSAVNDAEVRHRSSLLNKQTTHNNNKEHK